MLELLKEEVNFTLTENGALTYARTGSDCLDWFAGVGALRTAGEREIVQRFLCAYAEDADLAMKTLFFGRDVRGGLGERRVFRIVFHWLAFHEPQSVRRNINYIAEYGRYDDLLSLFGTPCETDMLELIRTQLVKDCEALAEGKEVSLLAKWLPSVNASCEKTVKRAKKIAQFLGMKEAAYRKMLTQLRGRIRILENNLRERDYTFEYEKQPSKALYKYRQAFLRNNVGRYQVFLERAQEKPEILHTATLAPYDVIAPLLKERNRKAFALSEAARHSMNVTWNALEDFTGSEHALVMVDGSASMYWSGNPCPAAVALSLGIYFAERNTGAFHNHFLTFSNNPQLVEIKGRDIVEKVRYCMQFQECGNTNLQKAFELLLKTAVKRQIPQEEMPLRLYIISDMEFDCCTDADAANFAYAKRLFAEHGYILPQVIFWNVQSRSRQQPVTKNEQGAALVSGCSPQIFSMLKQGELEPYQFMMSVLGAKRYERIQG